MFLRHLPQNATMRCTRRKDFLTCVSDSRRQASTV